MTGKDLKAAVAAINDDAEVLIDVPDVDDYVGILSWSTDVDGDLILTSEEIDFEEE